MTRTPAQTAIGAAAWAVAAAMLLLPPVLMVTEAFRHGAGAALSSLADPEAIAAIRLTVTMTIISVTLNTVMGVLAAWLLTRYRFPLKNALITLIELPLSVSPVVAGLSWMLIFGTQGWWGAALDRMNIHVAFAPAGILLATLFVTFPYVTRTLLPLMEQKGRDAEEAAMLLGASFWQILHRVTLPDVRQALLSGILLTTARAMGEFGAVSVVSGHIPGLTETMPLHIETLYNSYQTVAAFSMAVLLGMMSMIIVCLRSLSEKRTASTPAEEPSV